MSYPSAGDIGSYYFCFLTKEYNGLKSRKLFNANQCINARSLCLRNMSKKTLLISFMLCWSLCVSPKKNGLKSLGLDFLYRYWFDLRLKYRLFEVDLWDPLRLLKIIRQQNMLFLARRSEASTVMWSAKMFFWPNGQIYAFHMVSHMIDVYE